MGVRTLDISEYEDSREYPKYRPSEREYRPEHPSPDHYEYSRDYPMYRPAEQEYGPEDPPPDRFEDSREYRPEGFWPENPSRIEIKGQIAYLK